MLRVVIAAVLCLVLAAALSAWRLARVPLRLDFLVPHFNYALRDPAGKWRVEVGGVALQSDFRIHAHDVTVFDARGEAVLKVPDVSVLPSLAALLRGRLAPRAIEINGAEASVVRRRDGSPGISLALARPNSGSAVAGDGAAAVLAELLRPGEDSPIRSLRSVRLTGGRLRVTEAGASVSFRAEDMDVIVSRLNGELALAFDAGLLAGDDPWATPIAGQLRLRPAGEGIEIDGQLTAGEMDVGRLGIYWPENLAVPARRWVAEHIGRGRVREAVLNVALRSQQGRGLDLTRVDGSFRYDGLAVRWFDGAPEVVEIAGTASFDRAALRFDVTAARAGAIRIGAAHAALDGLDGGDERVEIEVAGDGPLADVLALVPAASAGFFSFRTEGAGAVTVGASFPLRSELSFSEVDLRVGVEPQAVHLSRDGIDAVVSGELRYRKAAGSHAAVEAELALLQARLEAGPYHWVQPPQRNGTLGLQLSLDDKGWRAERLELDCTSLRAKGSAAGSFAGGAMSIDLRDVVLGETKLAALAATWNGQAFAARLSGGALDLTPLLEGGRGGGTAGRAEKGSDDFALDIVASGLDRVSLGSRGWLEKVEAVLVRRNGEWQTAVVSGELPRALWSAGGAGPAPRVVSVRLEPSGAGRRLEASADDLGALLRAASVTGAVRGGTLVVSGRADESGPDARLRAHVSARSFSVVDAPLLLRVLALASLHRFAGTLRGDGLAFDSLEGTVVAQGGRYELQNLRGRGSSLGLTAAGWIDTGTDRLSIEGVLIPAYAASKALKSIPLLGDLLVGRDQSGLVAVAYKVRGSLSNPKVSANPLTALTPGMLREIWDLRPDE